MTHIQRPDVVSLQLSIHKCQHTPVSHVPVWHRRYTSSAKADCIITHSQEALICVESLNRLLIDMGGGANESSGVWHTYFHITA